MAADALHLHCCPLVAVDLHYSIELPAWRVVSCYLSQAGQILYFNRCAVDKDLSHTGSNLR